MDSQVAYTSIDYSILLFLIDLLKCLWNLNFWCEIICLNINVKLHIIKS